MTGQPTAKARTRIQPNATWRVRAWPSLTLARFGVVSVATGSRLSSLITRKEWTESSVAQKFLEQSPNASEARARAAIAQAQVKSRSFHANPGFNYRRQELAKPGTSERFLSLNRNGDGTAPSGRDSETQAAAQVSEPSVNGTKPR